MEKDQKKKKIRRTGSCAHTKNEEIIGDECISVKRMCSCINKQTG